MAKFWVWFLIILCGISLFFSVFWMMDPPSSETPPSSPSYILKDWGGRLALFRAGEAAPMEVYEVYTHLLPSSDVEQLRAGIPLTDLEEAERLLEDFGA